MQRQWLRRLLFIAVLIVVVVIGAGQAGLLAGKPPNGLGVHDGRLAAPPSTPNGVSSQADRLADHPQASHAPIDPLLYVGDGPAAMARLGVVLREMDGSRIVVERRDYIRVEFQTAILRFIDDTEFWLDIATGVIQVRSASRLGTSDLGKNRHRIERIRARFASQ